MAKSKIVFKSNGKKVSQNTFLQNLEKAVVSKANEKLGNKGDEQSDDKP
ncbi:hypothetical protein LPB85_10535 [Chryseobacterium sp. LC2016-27]|nr:hypothetical protein [Chryseobacterium sp. LC2016-27]MCD0455869.1 hypothetical protein [Chryseobacterium sp. LC2016-27]